MTAATDSNGSGGGLRTLRIGPRLTGAQAARRAALARKLRIALPILAAILVAAFLANARRDQPDEVFLKDFADLGAAPDELRMANPRFAGVDGKGNPYEITAETALQNPEAQEVVELVRPRAVTSRPEESTVVYAERGVFQSKENILTLKDGVALERAIGGRTYVLRASAATVDMDGETVVSENGVEGESEAGLLRADSMRAYNAERRVVFEGNVSMRIFPGKTKAHRPAENEGEQPQ
ncbi:LPS export ABC transporter periplasmic protein LptC [Amphiplicatus metriothermophilus]|uniref:Lipopolysaccharide export system protein LptC n=1 Tax=Amphiplicatus metriothermophilus TaxID=1519374 RepID=A0A239PKM9_9PROT|nr:LPS export ABC transporter periplasmic protein LptC [Amphiplicatus metriothermophilus]MBB5517296.1 lipopolysaccharide export system protein LptC [Amphiplicatus metriothermophilus]SNT68368.1 lipopolysaccharide export system protein LptC [Amphiplicatus metriothermophilus]